MLHGRNEENQTRHHVLLLFDFSSLRPCSIVAHAHRDCAVAVGGLYCEA